MLPESSTQMDGIDVSYVGDNTFFVASSTPLSTDLRADFRGLRAVVRTEPVTGGCYVHTTEMHGLPTRIATTQRHLRGMVTAHRTRLILTPHRPFNVFLTLKRDSDEGHGREQLRRILDSAGYVVEIIGNEVRVESTLMADAQLRRQVAFTQSVLNALSELKYRYEWDTDDNGCFRISLR